MGRLFWKFFLFIWLAQVAGMAATGVVLWFDHPSSEGHHDGPPPPGHHPHGPERHVRPPLPPPPLVILGLLASLLCAGGLAWYVARPIRRLKTAFDAVAAGNLTVHIGDGMGRRRDELADLGRDFDRMSEHLRTLMEGQKRLLHDVSHELRSPLARLQAAIGLARQQPARLEDSLWRIEREGVRMNVLVGELLTLSRLEVGVNGTLEEVDLSELLAGLVDDARFEAAARQQGVDLSEAPGLLVRANPELLHRAIENVLRNALRYSPAGATVRLETARLAGGRCRISILDQGPGVPAADLENIFQPFFRGEGGGEGYGLGLAIARRVIAAVDGRIDAKNRPGGGLQVDLELPAGKPA